jgi:hypothetical protein
VFVFVLFCFANDHVFVVAVVEQLLNSVLRNCRSFYPSYKTQTKEKKKKRTMLRPALLPMDPAGEMDAAERVLGLSGMRLSKQHLNTKTKHIAINIKTKHEKTYVARGLA